MNAYFRIYRVCYLTPRTIALLMNELTPSTVRGSNRRSEIKKKQHIFHNFKWEVGLKLF